MSTLSIKNITIRFGSFTAVDNVSFEAPEGSFVTLLGPSGCGKTTLLKTLAGFYSPNEGDILINGERVTHVSPEKRDTAMCFQSYALFPHLKVSENITFGPKQKKLSKSECAARLKKVSEQVDLDAQLDKLPSALSGGQQQRVALARALAMRSGIVLFDEPLSNLDAKLRDQVRFEIRQLQREHGFTAIYVTHDQAEALAMSDIILVMNAGKVVQMGSPQEIYHTPINRFVANFIGTANIMKAEVTARDLSNKFYQISTPIGRLKVCSDDPPKGDQIYVSWRPEEAQLQNIASEPQAMSGHAQAESHPNDNPSKAKDNLIKMSVIANVFLGNLNDLSVSPRQPLPSNQDEAVYRIQVLGSSQLQIGKEFTFYIPPNRIRFLEEASG